jgi:hypothetical protein
MSDPIARDPAVRKLPSQLLVMPGDEAVSITTLPSGLRIVSERMNHASTVSLGVWISAGSRDEADDQHGLAPRRSRRLAATSMPRPASNTPATRRAPLKKTCRWRSISSPTSCCGRASRRMSWPAKRV